MVSAVLLDVGGVFFVPDHELVAGELAGGGIEVDGESFRRAHYVGMYEVDRASALRLPFAGAYLKGVTRALGVPPEMSEWAVEAMKAIFFPRTASDLWRSPIPGSSEALRELSATGVGVAIVSNSDGTVEGKLRSMGVCQVGPGPGVSVGAVVDSAVAGVSKPDPEIFLPALAALGVDPAETWHVGDSVHYDVGGARAAGLHPIHFDPYGLCGSRDHDHAGSLGEVVSQVSPR